MDANVPPVPDERSGLLGFLAQQRRVLKHAAYGLTEEQRPVNGLAADAVVDNLAAAASWILQNRRSAI